MDFKELVTVVGYGIETVGVLILAVGCAVASIGFLSHLRKEPKGSAYAMYRGQLGRSIILGLEVLIAGDIIRTVVVSDTFKNVAILGLIILIRTFLSFTLHLEVEGRWPWKQMKENDVHLRS
jgi:uncharacterized membrane protein